MTKRLLHCRCCGQLSPAECNCCPKYHNAMAEITELKETLKVHRDEIDWMATVMNKDGADAIREMAEEYQNCFDYAYSGNVRNTYSWILEYADKLENQDG